MTAPYGDVDIDFCLKDIGVPVTAGSVSAFGAFDKEDQLLIQDGDRGEVIVTVPSVTVRTSLFSSSALAVDQPITVDGTDYYIRSREAATDGALKKLFLRLKTGSETALAPLAVGGRQHFYTPSTFDGVNRVFTLDAAPGSATVFAYFNGQKVSSPRDYSIAGNVVTMTIAPKPESSSGADDADELEFYW